MPAKPVRLTTSLNRWGQSILVLLCAGSTLFLTPVVRTANSQTATPSEATPFSYWSIKPWFLTEGKLAAVLIIPSSWGSQQIAITRASSNLFLAPLPGNKQASQLHLQQAWSTTASPTATASSFSGAVAGEKKHFCKGSLSLPIFLLCYCFAYFIFVCLLYQKHKKN